MDTFFTQFKGIQRDQKQIKQKVKLKKFIIKKKNKQNQLQTVRKGKNRMHKNLVQENNPKQSQLHDAIEPQEDDFEYQDEYEEEFENIEKSNQVHNLKDVLLKSNGNEKVENATKTVQQKLQNVMNKQVKNDPPSKENNWNQKPKITTEIQHQEEQHIKKTGNRLSNSIIKQQQQQEGDFDDIGSQQQHAQQQDQEQQPLVIQNQLPQLQSITLLSTKPQPSQISQKKTKQPPSPTPQLSKQQISHMIYQNQKTIKQLKQKTANYRQEIKNIGNLVDKDIQKSIVKIGNGKNPKTVNIKQLFSEIAKNQGQSGSLQKLREELFNIRNQSKVLKGEITSIEDKLNDPLTQENSLKYQQVESRLKQLSSQVNKKKQQKQFATQQLQRIKLSLGLAQFEQFQKSIQRNQQTLSKIAAQIKEKRSKIYRQEKHDMQLMEKLKYLVETNQKLQAQALQSEKSIGEEKMSGDQLKKNIKQLLSEINAIFEQRKTIENDKFKTMKSLQAEVESMENKNLQLLNQIRSIDASLLQFYTHKVQKKHSSVSRAPPKTAQKLHQTIDSGSPILREKHNQTTQQTIQNDKSLNDKNIVNVGSASMNKFRSKIQVKKNSVKQEVKEKVSAFISTEDLKEQQENEEKPQKDDKNQKLQIRLSIQRNDIKEKEEVTESKTVLSFGDLKVDEKGAILSDEILGKVKIREIHFFVDKKACYGVHCKYFNVQKPEIFGMKICEKNADEKCEKISLMLDTNQKQYISDIKVGYSLRNEIKLIEIITSLQKSLKWSVQNEVTRTQTKSLKKHSSICVKAKLISAEDPSTSKSLNELMIDRPKLKLAGLGFSVVEVIKSPIK